MRVTILGAGTAIPARNFSPAGIYVSVAKEHVVLDTGSGTLQRLFRCGVTFLDIDRIVLTHLHPDHSLDLVALLFAMRLPYPARSKPLTIYGPRGLKLLISRLSKAYQGWISPKSYKLTIKEIGEGTIRLPGYMIKTKRMRHSTNALGIRIQTKKKSFVFSGDTQMCPNIVKLGDKASALTLECSMPDERKVSGHLTPSECGQIAASSKARHLVLTHFYPVFKGYPVRQRVRRYFKGRLTLARDFTSFEV